MTLEEVIEVMRKAHSENKDVVRLHTGDPAIYGAIKEQMDELDKFNIDYSSSSRSKLFFSSSCCYKKRVYTSKCNSNCNI